MHVIVVGAGVIGSAVAYRLARSGARVTVLEAGRPAGGTSGTTLAWLNSNNKNPLPYHLLNRAGMAEHAVLARELNGGAWLHLDGNFIWGRPDLLDLVERQRGRGYEVQVLTPEEVGAIEPDLAVPAGIDRVAFYPAEGYVDVPVLVGALLRAARQHGAKVRSGAAVTGFRREGERVTGVRTEAEEISADQVVLCVGRWTDRLLEAVDMPLPLAPSWGLVAVSNPLPIALRSLVHTPEVNFRPDGAGRVLMNVDEIDEQVRGFDDASPTSPLAEELRVRTARVLPPLADGYVEACRVAIRAFPADGVTIAGEVTDGLYAVCTHSGVTLGPLLGRLAAREVLTEKTEPMLADFRPGRFALKTS